MLTTGEFSRATRLTIKALRLYHDEGLLVPEKIDPVNGYRYYGDASFSRASAITLLKGMGFSVKEMKDILDSCHDDAELAGFLRSRLAAIDREIEESRRIRDRLAYFIEKERIESMDDTYGIVEKNLDPITVCSIRYRGKYSDFGIPFGELFRKIGRYARGAPFSLYHDGEYREEDADIEVSIAVSKALSAAGIDCRVLEGARVVSLRYRGPYDGIGAAYRRVFEYIGERGYEAKLPSRELYLRGPGMILPRSPKNFVTEIQIPV